MTAQRLSRLAAGIAIVTVLGVTALVTRNVLWPEDPDASLQRANGKVMGDMAGYVGRVDREARTVDISTSPLGIRPVVLLVTNETAIVVNGKQGAIGDLWKDLPVRAFYEVRDNARYATSIQVTAGDGLASSPAAKDASPGPAGTPTADRPAAEPSTKETKAPAAPASSAQAPAPTAPAPVASATPPTPPASVVPRPASVPPASAVNSAPKPPALPPIASKPVPAAPPPEAVASTPKPVTAPPAPVQPPAPRVAESAPARIPTTAAAPAPAATAPAPAAAVPAPAAESASVASARTGNPAPTETDADGSAAIDWLIKGGGRR